MVKFVRKATFSEIQKLFPQAIPHPIKRKCGQIQPCSICTQMNQFKKEFPSKLRSLLENHSSLFDEHPQIRVDIEDSFYLVHDDDFKNIHKVCKLIQKKCPPTRKVSERVGQQLKERLISEYFQNETNSSLSQINSNDDNKLNLRWSLHNLICTHGKSNISSSSVRRIILGCNEKEEEETHPIQILSKEKFQLFLSFILELQALLFADGKEEVHSHSIKMEETFAKKFPRVQLKDNEEILIQPDTCQKNCSNSELLKSNVTSIMPEENKKNKKTSLMEEVEVNKKMGVAASSETSDVKSNDTYFIKVYAFDQSNTNFNSIKTEMEKFHSNVDSNTVREDSRSSCRRSTRKRKKDCVASPTTLELKKDSILACLILAIYEHHSEIRLTDQKLFLFQYDGTSKKGNMHDLSNYEDEEKIGHVLDEKVKDDSNVEIILIRSEMHEKESKKKREIDEEYRRNELLELMYNSKVSDGSISSKRRRTEERGFQGTFLQSDIMSV